MSNSGRSQTTSGILRRMANLISSKQRKSSSPPATSNNFNLNWEMSPSNALNVNILGTGSKNANKAKAPATAPIQNSSTDTDKIDLDSTIRLHPDEPSSASKSTTSELRVEPLGSVGNGARPFVKNVVYGNSDQYNATVLQQSVLLVEPNEKIKGVLHELLDRIGVIPLMASSAKEAMMVLKQYRPSVVLVDADLPDMPGTKLVATIRDREWGASLPIVMMASNDEDLHSGEGAWLDISDYLYKPFNVHALQTVLKAHINIEEYDSNVVHRGTVGLVIEDTNQRIRIRRFLVRNGFSVAMSCGPANLDSYFMYQGAMQIESWLVQVKDEDRCMKVLDELDEYSEVPVLTGFEPMPHPKDEASKLAYWQKSLLRKLQKSVASSNPRGDSEYAVA